MGSTARFLRLNMPSADSPYALDSPCGSLTLSSGRFHASCFVVSAPFRGGSSIVETWGPIDAGGLGAPDSPPPVSLGGRSFETHGASRGKHWLLSAHDRQIYGKGHQRIEDFVLCCGLVPPPPRLESACPPPFGAGHTCTSTRAFASGFLQPPITGTTLPLAILPLRLGGSGL